jgi:hypothetical protein
MRVAIDSSSLLTLVRYYLPFDRDQRLFTFIKQKVKAKEIIVIEEVYLECKGIAQGAVVKALSYLDERSNRLKTDELLASPTLITRVENDFAIGVQKRKLNEAEFESRKMDYMADADFKLVLLGLKERESLDPITIVTEERIASNDGKDFKKIPAICKLQGIDLNCYDLPTYLKNVDGIDFGVN